MDKILFPLIGGILIGISSSIILYVFGRIAGISGIISAIFNPSIKSEYWKISFLSGLISGGILLRLVEPNFFSYSIGENSSVFTILIAGLFVGFGTQLGNGCTSGHGVCGLPRLSPRSIIATITFMLVGILTVAIKNFLGAL